MKDSPIYILFNGNCEEALQFYQHCFNGTCSQLSKFSEGPMEVPEHHKNKVMHARFESKYINFMASDGQPDKKVVIGSNIQLCPHLDNREEQTEVFEKLSEGATIVMPLQDTFWGARFGMLIDKFGIHWMFNYHTEEPKK